VGHLAREKRARWLGSAAPYTDYLLIYHAAGGDHLSFHSANQTSFENRSFFLRNTDDYTFAIFQGLGLRLVFKREK